MNKGIAGLLVGLVVVLLAAEGKIAPLWSALTTKTIYDPFPGASGAGDGTAGFIGPPLPRGNGAGYLGPPLPAPGPTVIANDAGWSGAAGGFTLFPIPIPGSNPAFDSVRDNWPAGSDAEWEAFKQCYQTHGSITDCATLRAGSKG